MSFFKTNQFYAIVGLLLFLLGGIVTAFEIRSLIKNKQGITPSDIKILWSGIGFSVLGAVVFFNYI